MSASLTTPPRWVIRITLAVRGWLLRLADLLVPRQVVLAERATAFAHAELLRLAAHLGIADHLATGPRGAADLAARTETDADSLDRALRALVDLGVFRRSARGTFANNRLSTGLRADWPGSWRSFAVAMGSPAITSAWSDLERSVRTGRSAFERVHGKPMWEWLSGQTEDCARFADAMTAQTAIQAHALARSPAFTGIDRLCDVGGGHGALLAEVLVLHPRTRGVLFDRAEVVAGARPLLESRGVADRVELIAGDMFATVPPGCDAYVLKNILHNWSDDQSLRLLRTLRSAMSAGQRVLVIEMLRDRSLALAAFSDIQMLVVHEGRERDRAHFAALFEKSGFTLLRTSTTRTLFDVLHAEAR